MNEYVKLIERNVTVSDRIYRIRDNVSISKSMVKCKINIDTDFTDYTDFHNNY